MTEMITRIYALLVCFVCMVCITISTGMGLYNLVKIVNPALTLDPYQYQHLTSNDHYQRGLYPVTGIYGEVMRKPPAPEGVDEKPRSKEEIKAMREAELASLLDRERRVATASLIRLVIVLLVTCPVFYIHWRIAQRQVGTD